MSHCVLLPDFDPANLEPLSKPAADAYGVTPADARLRIRQGWGFLEWDSPRDRASEIANKLKLSGFRAELIEVSALRQPGDTAIMSGFELTSDGLLPEVRAQNATTRIIPWNEILIVAAGGFSEEVMQSAAIDGQSKAAGMIKLGILLSTGIPVGMFKGGKKKKGKKPASSTLFVSFGQIVTTRNEAFFFNSDSFNYTGLGEAKQMSSAQNYRALIALLAQRSSARINMGARCVIEKKGMSAANYESIDDFERELLWMLNTGSL